MSSSLPFGWRSVRVAEVASSDKYACVGGPFGSNLTRRDYVDEPGVPVIRGANMGTDEVQFLDSEFVYVSEEKAQTLVQNMARPGDLVFTQRGTLGQVAWIPETAQFEEYVISQSQMKLTVDPDIADPGFVYGYFRSPVARQIIESRAVATGVPHINLGILRDFPLPLPPLNEQRRIAEVLGALDDKIEANRQMSETLDALARVVFRERFGRFGPEDDLPSGWKRSKLADEFSFTMGQSPPGSTYNEEGEGLPFYQGATDFGFRFPGVRKFCSAPTRLAEPGDTLVGVRAPVGITNMARETLCLGRGVAALRHKSGARSYTYWAADDLHQQFEVFNGEGTVFGSINKKDFSRLRVVAPTTEEIAAFEREIGVLDDRVESNHRQNETLTALRDRLIPALLSGAVRVDHALADAAS